MVLSNRAFGSLQLLALLAILCLNGLPLSAQDEISRIENLPTEKRLGELRQLAIEILELIETRDSPISLKEARALKKIEKQVDPAEYILVWELYDELVAEREQRTKDGKKKSVNTTDQKNPKPKIDAGVVRPIEELFVSGTPFSGVPLHPDEFNVGDINYMRGIRSVANNLYAKGDYAEAYPLLLELSKRGFKDSQSRLAYILFHGTEGVPKSNYRALGWLGAAANGRTEPIFRVLLNRHLRKVPPNQLDQVKKVIAGYQEEFGYPEQVKCGTNHPFSNGLVKRVYCEFKLEQIANACQGLCWAHKVNNRKEG